MPLIELGSKQAVDQRKGNPLAMWPNRTQPNRVEPVCVPSFDTPFLLEPGEKVFTIGSCFARNIETKLGQRGFRLPMRDLLANSAFEGLDPGVLNNFGTPSIRNEIAWAFDELPFVEESQFVELSDGLWADQNLLPNLRAEPIENVRARREGRPADARRHDPRRHG